MTLIFTLIMWISIAANAINLYPLPAWVTNDFRIQTSYGMHQFKSLSDSNLDLDLHNIIDVGFKWGDPFQGLSFGMQFFNQAVTTPINGDINQIIWALNTFKIRWLHPIIDGEFSSMSGFVSFGSFLGATTYKTFSETSGIKAYKERSVTGYLADIGVVFGYEMNPDWHLFIQTMVQVSFSETSQDLIGISSPDIVDFSGAQAAIGTILKL